MSTNPAIGRSHSRRHYHEQSMDDFMKNIKKFNMRSERYISPKPLLYMYAKNNTYNTIQKSRSRTLSNHKSHSKSKRSVKQKQKTHKSKSKTMKTKLQKIFNTESDSSSRVQVQPNPARFIEKCGDKLKKAQKYLDGKSVVGHYLCETFLKILNQIVEKMVSQLDRQLNEIENKTVKQVERKYLSKIQKMQSKMYKMSNLVKSLNERAENNSRLLYELRLTNQIDIDYIFGKAVLGTDKCGGFGYSKHLSQSSQSEQHLKRQNQQIKNLKNKLEIQKQIKVDKKLNAQLHQFKLHLNMDNEFTEQKQSGRIRQAYDWQREAYDGKQKQKYKNKTKKLQTQHSPDQQQSDEKIPDFLRKST